MIFFNAVFARDFTIYNKTSADLTVNGYEIWDEWYSHCHHDHDTLFTGVDLPANGSADITQRGASGRTCDVRVEVINKNTGVEVARFTAGDSEHDDGHIQHFFDLGITGQLVAQEANETTVNLTKGNGNPRN